MSNSTNSSALGELLVDATREIIEKGRIKAQMTKLERIMTADKLQLKKIYAEIGKMYSDNTIQKKEARLEYLRKAIKHLNTRLERAQARMDMLKEAHSVDECTEAFRTELSAKIKQAQDSAATAAYAVKKKAKDVAANIGETAETIKNKIVNAKNEETPAEDDTDFTDLLTDLELEDDSPAPETDEDAQVNSILSNLDAMIKEVEETAENTEESTDAAPADGESAENFDF